jgi:AcrR family transcriptional regulator
MAADWLVGDAAALAAERILDAAGRCFAEKGVARTSVHDIARAAGCSRPTVYRYFEDRDALRTAFVHREARRLGAEVLAAVDHEADPGERLVAAVLTAVRGVRANPTLAAWFAAGAVAETTDVARSSAVLESLVAAFMGPPGDEAVRARARWVLRVVLSLLSVPARDETEERALLERFVVPVVVAAG